MNKGEIRYKIFPEMGLYIVYHSGVLTLDVGINHIKSLYNDPEFNPAFDNIRHLGSSYLDVSSDEIQKFNEFLGELPGFPHERKVIFVANDPNQMVKSSLFSLLSRFQPMEVNVVGTMEEATESIGLDEDQARFIADEMNQLIKRKAS